MDFNELTEIESVVVITTLQPLLLLWLAAISFFISLALTAMVSPNRRWFELTVIFAILYLVNLLLGGLIIQGFFGIEMVQLEAIHKITGR